MAGAAGRPGPSPATRHRWTPNGPDRPAIGTLGAGSVPVGADAGPATRGSVWSRGRGLGGRGPGRRTRGRDGGRRVPEVGDPVLEAVEAGQQAPVGVVDRGQQQPGAEQLELQARRGGPLQLGQPRAHEVGRPGELRQPEVLDLPAHRVDLGVRGVEQPRLHGVGDLVQDHEVAQTLEQVRREPSRVQAGVDHPVHDGEHPRPVARRERVDDLVEHGGVGDAELGDGVGVGQTLGTGARDELAEHGQGVAHRARTRARDEGEGLGLRRDALLLGHPAEMLLQPADWHEAVGVVVGARADGREDLVRLRRREDELEVPRWLLDQLEQGVGRVDGQLVRLVDDVDLVAARRGGVHRLLAQLPGVVDAAVARGVHLDDVDRPGAVGREVAAARALAARVRRRPLLAVERPRQDARGRGLAAATWPGEQVGVVRTAGVDGTRQRHRDVLLADDVGQPPGAVGAVEGQGHASTLAPPSDARAAEPDAPGRPARPRVTCPRSDDGGRERSALPPSIRGG